MKIHHAGSEDSKGRIKWLIAFRLVFAGVLLGATLLFCASESIPFMARPFIFLIAIALVLFVLSALYFLLLNVWGIPTGLSMARSFLIR